MGVCTYSDGGENHGNRFTEDLVPGMATSIRSPNRKTLTR